ncbi:hypothetical protein BC834DRAFT_902869 [Gloeopeniophorella convolvens]|nr:hypothetical protein BC834DRAFT_902869 [Gloeopeniophorella convolvens]
MIETRELVLVTEASGFIGSHIVEHLLKAGYRVRGTVEPAKAVALRAAYFEYRDRFDTIEVTDLDTDDLTDAFRGVSAAIVASLTPLPGKATKTAKKIVESGYTATKHILEHARAANVKKVVLTGSSSNVLHPDDTWKPIVVTEDDWNPQTASDCKKLGVHPLCVFTAARIIAEREFWEFADANPDIAAISILPGTAFGPYGRGQASDSHGRGTFAWLNMLLNGAPGRPIIQNGPPFSPNYVHVEDVARAHVAALRTSVRRARVLLVAGYVLWPEVVTHLARTMPALRSRLPRPASAAPHHPPMYARFEGRNARDVLGIEELKGWEEAMGDAVASLLRAEPAAIAGEGTLTDECLRLLKTEPHGVVPQSESFHVLSNPWMPFSDMPPLHMPGLPSPLYLSDRSL